MIVQGPRIDFKSEGAKIVLYKESLEGASMVDAVGKISFFGSLERRKCHPVRVFKICHGVPYGN